MSIRFYPLLLTAFAVVVLNACTTPTRPGGDVRREPDLSTEPAAPTDDSVDRQFALPGLALAQVIELSKNISTYQPDTILEILRSLETVSSGQLKNMIDSQQYDPEFTEWLELTLMVRTSLLNGEPMAAVARHWANYHYGHVVDQDNFADVASRYSNYFPTPTRVAILLPDEGGLAAAGTAIRDGIVAAYLERPGQSAIRFYSSGESDESAVAAYRQARAEGATQIVGPLRVESTRALARIDLGNMPVLLLNKPDESLEPGPITGSFVSSLSLSQTEEAASIAENALALGQDRSIMIVPDSGWGRRIETAFATAFSRGGGRISAAASFDPSSSDHNDMLTRLLKIDESNQRKTELQSRLGITLSFEPIRRDDFDFVFMASNPKQGRELKPLLRFHDVGDIPVYAMSRVYSGKVDQNTDQDLNGVVFAATSWQLQTANERVPSLESLRDGAFGNLYALGQDAWHLLPWLPLMQKDPDLWFSGETGDLRMQANGNLQRRPAWAQFSAGRPTPYQWPDNFE